MREVTSDSANVRDQGDCDRGLEACQTCNARSHNASGCDETESHYVLLKGVQNFQQQHFKPRSNRATDFWRKRHRRGWHVERSPG